MVAGYPELGGQEISFFVCTDRDKDFSLLVLRKLKGCQPNSARGRVDENGLVNEIIQGQILPKRWRVS